METICKNCKKEFKSNRRDTQYCTQKCKNAYNNKQKSEIYHITQAINEILLRNRTILKELHRLTHVKKKQLQEASFDFNYHTHEYMTDHFNRVYFCYDYGIQEINSTKFKLYHHEQIQINQPY